MKDLLLHSSARIQTLFGRALPWTIVWQRSCVVLCLRNLLEIYPLCAREIWTWGKSSRGTLLQNFSRISGEVLGTLCHGFLDQEKLHRLGLENITCAKGLGHQTRPKLRVCCWKFTPYCRILEQEKLYSQQELSVGNTVHDTGPWCNRKHKCFRRQVLDIQTWLQTLLPDPSALEVAYTIEALCQKYHLYYTPLAKKRPKFKIQSIISSECILLSHHPKSKNLKSNHH